MAGLGDGLGIEQWGEEAPRKESRHAARSRHASCKYDSSSKNSSMARRTSSKNKKDPASPLDTSVTTMMTFKGHGLGRSSLHVAAGYGRLRELNELLQNGADTGTLSDSGRIALHEACQSGHEECVQALIEVSDISSRDRQGRTPAHLAAINGDLRCLTLLHEAGVSLDTADDMGRTICHLAAERDHIEILKFADPEILDIPDILGKTTLHIAATFGALRCIRYLMENDCSQYRVDGKNSSLPVHHAAANNQLQAVRFFVKHGISRDVTQKDGRTPLHVACSHGALDVVHWLVNSGADTTKMDVKGFTPYHVSASSGHATCYNCLHTYATSHLLQVDQMINGIGDNPKQTARKSGHPILIQRAIDNEIRCKLCKTLEESTAWKRKHGQAGLFNDASLEVSKRQSPLKQVEAISKVKGAPTMNKRKSKGALLPPRELSTQFICDNS